MRGARDILRALLRDPAALVGLVLLAGAIAVAAGAGFIAEDPFEMVGGPAEPPFGEYLFGTDTLGRSIGAGLAYGARVSLAIGLITSLVSTSVGVIVGGTAGYLGGRVDGVLMRLTELFQTVPAMLLAIVVVSVLQPSIGTVVAAIATVSWAPLARLVRAEFLSLRTREFVQSCRVMGMGHARIMATQILPNAASSIVVAGSITVATSILYEAGLSFLGLSDPNVMSWGMMIGQGRTVLRTAWWVSAVPGIAVLTTVLAINLVGDGLNEAINPKSRRVGR